MVYRFYKNLGQMNAQFGFPFESESIPSVPNEWDGVWNNEQLAAYNESLQEQPLPSTYEQYTTIAQFKKAFELYGFSLNWRRYLKTLVCNFNPEQLNNESAGFEAIAPGNPTHTDKAFVARFNIGTGVQRLLAIPNDQERDLSCFQYIDMNEGIPLGSDGKPSQKGLAAVWLKALSFSRCDHIFVPEMGASMPSWIFAAISITSAAPYEFSGNLLRLFGVEGIKGFYAGNAPLGISDYIQETGTAQGLPFDTRYAPANGGGLRTNAVLVAAVDADTYGISGCEDLNEFADLMFSVIENGMPIYD